MNRVDGSLTVIPRLREDKEPRGFLWVSWTRVRTKTMYGLNSAVRRVFSTCETND